MSAAARATAPARGTVYGTPLRAPRTPAPPRLRVVPPANLPAPRAPFVLLVLGLVVAGLVSLLMLNTLVNENSFQIHALTTEQEQLDLREQQLKRQVDKLETPGSMEAAARRLGLVPAGTPAFIQLPDGRVLGVPTPAKRTSSTGGGR
jgi:cell division protein FtsB